jgi:hypothetical protein
LSFPANGEWQHKKTLAVGNAARVFSVCTDAAQNRRMTFRGIPTTESRWMALPTIDD